MAVADSAQKITRIQAVITNPDKERGKGLKLSPTPIKVWAQKENLKIIEAGTLRGTEIKTAIEKIQPDIFIVAAYGKIIPHEILMIPRLGAINIHPSLLPRWRGAAPVVHTILSGDIETGTTLILLADEVDAGPIISQKRLFLSGNETTGDLNKKLFQLGASMLEESLDGYGAGSIKPQPQPATGITYAPKINNNVARLDWLKKAEELEREVRAYNPEPGSFFEYRKSSDKKIRVKVLQASVLSEYPNAKAGTVLMHAGFPIVATAQHALKLTEVQPESKKPMSGNAFIKGHQAMVNQNLLTVGKLL